MLKIAKFRPENIAAWLTHKAIPIQAGTCIDQIRALMAPA